MKDLIWLKVKNKEEVVIHCPTIESAIDFMEECAERKIDWASSIGPVEIKKDCIRGAEDICWGYYKENTLYYINVMGVCYSQLKPNINRDNNFFEWRI